VTDVNQPTSRCQWCEDYHRHLDEAERRVQEQGLPANHPLVKRAMNRARIAEQRAEHPMTFDGECPSRPEVA
jgi:aromatic ring hydroxylase